MAADGFSQARAEIGPTLDLLASASDVQSNCMFQLAIMLARIAVEPCPESYKDASAQAMRRLVETVTATNDDGRVEVLVRAEA